MEQEEEREERLRFRSMDEWHMNILLLDVLIRMMIMITIVTVIAAGRSVGKLFNEAKLGQPP